MKSLEIKEENKRETMLSFFQYNVILCVSFCFWKFYGTRSCYYCIYTRTYTHTLIRQQNLHTPEFNLGYIPMNAAQHHIFRSRAPKGSMLHGKKFQGTEAFFSSSRNLKSFQNSVSHQILRHIHKALNIDKNKN